MMIPITASESKNQDTNDNVYFNAFLINPSPDPLISSIMRVDYQYQSVRPILQNPSDYEMAAVRMFLPGSSLPIVIWSEMDNLNLSVRMTYNGSTVDTLLVYVDYSLPLNGQLPATAIFQYQAVINFVNTAFQTCFTDLKLLQPAAPQTIAPYLVLDPATQLISLYAETSYDYKAALPMNVYFSIELFNRFFPSFAFVSTVRTVPPVYYQLDISDHLTNVVTISAVNYYRMAQEYPTINLWNSVQTILMETSDIPVSSEFITSAKGSTRLVAFDFQPQQQTNNRSPIQYFPQGPLRWYDLWSASPLTKIDLRGFYQTREGSVYPIFLLPDETFTMKLRFRRKKGARGS